MIDTKELKEFFETLAAMCKSYSGCTGCPLEKADVCGVSNTKANWVVIIPAVEAWHNDRSRKIEPTEVVRVYTFEATEAVDYEVSPEGAKFAGKCVAKRIKDKYDFDDVICTKAQQFVTKWRDAE